MPRRRPPPPDEPWEPFDEEKTALDQRAPLDEAAPEEVTPSPETGRHSTLTPAQFASAVDLADRDAYARGLERGRAAETVRAREDVIESFRGLWVIFEIGAPEKPAPDWETAVAWVRRRLTPPL